MSRPSKADLREQAEHIPISSILGKGSGQALTAKQKKFAREIVKGKSKAQAYREAYPNAKSKATQISEPYKLSAHPIVAQEIAALEAAERASAYRTPSRLRALVVETLTQVVTDTSQRTSDRLRAAQLIGQITEVAAFTERKEVRTINTSEAARARVLEEIKSLMAASDDVVDVQAKSLLDELSGNITTSDQTQEPTHDDSGGEYDPLQVIDSYRADPQQEPGSARKSGVLPPPGPEVAGGV